MNRKSELIIPIEKILLSNAMRDALKNNIGENSMEIYADHVLVNGKKFMTHYVAEEIGELTRFEQRLLQFRTRTAPPLNVSIVKRPIKIFERVKKFIGGKQGHLEHDEYTVITRNSDECEDFYSVINGRHRVVAAIICGHTHISVYLI